MCTIIVSWGPLVMRASPDHLGHVLGLLVDRSGSQHRAWRGRLAHHHVDGAGLSQLTVQLVQVCGVLWKRATGYMHLHMMFLCIKAYKGLSFFQVVPIMLS